LFKVCIGQAHGTAALLLSLGNKGKRYAFPNSSIMIHEGTTERTSSSCEANSSQGTINELLSKSCGKSIEEVSRVRNQMKFFSAEEAVNCGLIDEILGSKKGKTFPVTGS
jgi:ATP-dependent Clp protease protease subunit